MTKHTPGPWRVHQHEHMDGELWLSIGHRTTEGAADPSGRWIGPVAELKYLIARDEEQWANARLIAAAPDLLAALHLAAEALDAYSDVNDGDDGRPTPNRAMSALQDIGEVIAKAEGQPWVNRFAAVAKAEWKPR